jgi:ribonuclease III
VSLWRHIRRLFAGTSPAEARVDEVEAAGLRLTSNDFSAITGVPVADLSLYVMAMRHRSLLRGRVGSAVDSNERLEYLGDAILGFVTADHLFKLYPGEDEGFLTRLRSKLVNGNALAAHAQSLGLDKLIMISDNLRQQGQTQMFTSIMADAFEALVGAIYLDQGTEAARSFVVENMLAQLDLDELMRLEDNPKSLLLEFAQARAWLQPVYRVRTATGPSHQRTFTVDVLVRGEPVGAGVAGSKKQAEQHAAAEALGILRASHPNESDNDFHKN